MSFNDRLAKTKAAIEAVLAKGGIISTLPTSRS